MLSTFIALFGAASMIGGLYFMRMGYRDGFVTSMLFTILMAVQSEGFRSRAQGALIRKDLAELKDK